MLLPTLEEPGTSPLENGTYCTAVMSDCWASSMLMVRIGQPC